LLNNSDLNQKEIAKILNITPKTVSKIKKRYLDEELESALNDKPRSGQPKKYDDEKEAEIIALACTDPPEGRKNGLLS
jgi:transposase